MAALGRDNYAAMGNRLNDEIMFHEVQTPGDHYMAVGV
jgi:hypothetical protein